MKKNYYIPSLYLFVSTVILLYIFYKSEIVAGGFKDSYYNKFYFIVLCFYFFSLITFFLKKETNFKLLIVIISTTLSIYCIEIFFFYKNKLNETVLEAYKIELVEEYLKPDPQIVPMIYPFNFVNKKDQEIFPLSGISKKETIMSNENGYLAKYFSDRFGFNNPDNVWDLKEIDFVLIGDSFTHGMSVLDKDTIRGNIENKTGKGVISLGYSGNGPLIELATLKEYLPLTNSKRVIWIYYEGNDLEDLLFEKTNSTLRNYLTNKKNFQELNTIQNIINKKLLIFLHEQLKKKKKKYFVKTVTDFIKIKNLRNFIFNISLSEKNIYKIPQDFKKTLQEAKRFTEQKNSKFYFVYMPEKRRYEKKFEDNLKFRHYKEVLEIVKSLNIDVIDLNKNLLKKESKPLSLFSEGGPHLNEMGYNLSSDIILDKINIVEK